MPGVPKEAPRVHAVEESLTLYHHIFDSIHYQRKCVKQRPSNYRKFLCRKKIK